MNLTEDIKALSKEGFSGQVMEKVSLREYTSLRIGGPCDVMLSPKDPYSLKVLLEFLNKNSIDYFVLGGGTNVLISDKGFRGVVITLRHWQRIEKIETSEEEDTLFVMAGTSLSSLLGYSADNALQGLEGLVGIPGTVGGATAGNAGAYGYEFMDTVDRVTLVSRKGMEVMKKKAIDYGYRRTSIADVVVAVHLRLKKGDSHQIKARMKEFLEQKKATQPLGELSAGCVFKNPPGLSAGRLIEEAGLKGKRIGGVQVSQKHANFFINLGTGTAEDFRKLMDLVSQEVQRIFSISLEPEIRLLGFD